MASCGEIDWLVACLTETVAVTGFLINVRQYRWKNVVGFLQRVYCCCHSIREVHFHLIVKFTD